MITTFLLTMLNNFVVGLLGLLPSGHLPQAITDAFAYFFAVANQFSFVVPMDTLLQAVAVLLVFDGALFLWYVINWVIRKIPGMQ